ncbi:hypothetical protein [Microbacterium sp.]
MVEVEAQRSVWQIGDRFQDAGDTGVHDWPRPPFDASEDESVDVCVLE